MQKYWQKNRSQFGGWVLIMHSRFIVRARMKKPIRQTLIGVLGLRLLKNRTMIKVQIAEMHIAGRQVCEKSECSGTICVILTNDIINGRS